MSTETQASRELVTVTDPASGEVIDLKDSETGGIVRAVERVEDLVAQLAEFRQALVDEVATRLDAGGERKRPVTVGDDVVELETNAPTTEDYRRDVLEEELRKLIPEGAVTEELIARVIRRPPPKPQERKVDKREVNKLKRSSDRRVLAALAAARSVNPTKRTLKVKRQAAE